MKLDRADLPGMLINIITKNDSKMKESLGMYCIHKVLKQKSFTDFADDSLITKLFLQTFPIDKYVTIYDWIATNVFLQIFSNLVIGASPSEPHICR